MVLAERQIFPESNLCCRLPLVVPDVDVQPGLHQDPGELPFAHGGRDVEGRVSVLVLLGHPALGTDQDPRGPRVAVPCGRVERTVAKLKIFHSLSHGGKEGGREGGKEGGREGGSGGELNVTHVVLDVRPAAAGEKDPAGLVVTMLAGHVEGSEPRPVLHVDVGPAGAEESQAPAEPVLGRQVERRVPLQLVLLVHSCSSTQ